MRQYIYTSALVTRLSHTRLCKLACPSALPTARDPPPPLREAASKACPAAGPADLVRLQHGPRCSHSRIGGEPPFPWLRFNIHLEVPELHRNSEKNHQDTLIFRNVKQRLKKSSGNNLAFYQVLPSGIIF